jgi:hypothetical protein
MVTLEAIDIDEGKFLSSMLLRLRIIIASADLIS